ncbi:MAG: acyl-CoA dehydrogenase family protein [Spongiibacteraceae bacterium]
MSTETTKITGFTDQRVDAIIQELIALRPMLQENAPIGEKLRCPAPDADAALRGLGMYNLITPTRWGGAGLSTSGFAKIQIEVAKCDPSLSWVVQILNGTTWVATLGSDALQEGLFGAGPAPVCGAYNPPGKAKKVDGGYIINGRWPYSSGSRQAQWYQGGCMIDGDGGPIVPGINMAYLPMSEIEIVDSWYVTGMQGTGSDTVVAKDVFIPEHMLVTMDKPFGHIEEGKKHIGAASDFLPVVPTVRATGLAQLLGAAEYMLELTEADAKTKPIITTTYAKRTDSHVHITEIGRIAAILDNARVLLFDATGQLDAAAVIGRKFSQLEAAKHKAQCSTIVELIHSAVEKIMFLAGSSAFSLDKPIQRYWRDVHVGLRHVQNIPQLGFEIYGRDRLDLTPNISPPGAY